jgi:tRNA-Thr(GGU) m(6)t(6)A37 methyltransferase TsaA
MATDEMTYRAIGIVHSPYRKTRGTPIQSTAAQGIEGSIELLPQYSEGLEGLEGFSHIILLYHFHLSKKYSLKVKPYLDDQSHGVFATRAPSRPNPIGISIVQLTKIEGTILYITDVDVVDGTPLLDIKPYVREFDARDVRKQGWLEDKLANLQKVKDDGRFADYIKDSDS